MYLRAEIYDPTTGDRVTLEHYVYPELIEKIREYGRLEINLDNPPAEKETYLWVNLMFVQKEEVPENEAGDSADGVELLDKNDLYFRINKLLFTSPYAAKPGDSALSPGETLDEQAVTRLYPAKTRKIKLLLAQCIEKAAMAERAGALDQEQQVPAP